MNIWWMSAPLRSLVMGYDLRKDLGEGGSGSQETSICTHIAPLWRWDPADRPLLGARLTRIENAEGGSRHARFGRRAGRLELRDGDFHVERTHGIGAAVFRKAGHGIER